MSEIRLLSVYIAISNSLQENSPWLPGEVVPVTHGSYFWYAHNESLLAPNNANIVNLLLLLCMTFR